MEYACELVGATKQFFLRAASGSLPERLPRRLGQVSLRSLFLNTESLKTEHCLRSHPSGSTLDPRPQLSGFKFQDLVSRASRAPNPGRDSLHAVQPEGRHLENDGN